MTAAKKRQKSNPAAQSTYRWRQKFLRESIQKGMTPAEAEAALPESLRRKPPGGRKKAVAPPVPVPVPVPSAPPEPDPVQEREALDREGIQQQIERREAKIETERTGVDWPLPSTLLGDPVGEYWGRACALCPENTGKSSMSNVITVARLCYELARYDGERHATITAKEWLVLKLQTIKALDGVLNEIKKTSLQHGQTDASARILKEIYGYVDPRRGKGE